jgi:hypothetical protein
VEYPKNRLGYSMRKQFENKKAIEIKRKRFNKRILIWIIIKTRK